MEKLATRNAYLSKTPKQKKMPNQYQLLTFYNSIKKITRFFKVKFIEISSLIYLRKWNLSFSATSTASKGIELTLLRKFSLGIYDFIILMSIIIWGILFAIVFLIGRRWYKRRREEILIREHN